MAPHMAIEIKEKDPHLAILRIGVLFLDDMGKAEAELKKAIKELQESCETALKNIRKI